MNIFGSIKPTLILLNYNHTLFKIYKYISKKYTTSFLFESITGPKELAEISVIGFNPTKIIKIYQNKLTIKYNNKKKIKIIKTNNPLNIMKKMLITSSNKMYRYIGGAVGVIHYDAIRLWEKIPGNNNQILMEFGIYDDGIIHDKKNKKLIYFYYHKNRLNELKFTKTNIQNFYASHFIEDDEKQFKHMFKKAKKHLYAGDIFQVVLSRKIKFTLKGDSLKIYKILRKINPSPYLYHMKFNNKIIIGASPEMLLRITNNIIETFPIAGTRKITNNKSDNKRLMKELLNDKKEIAEHTMLVDLGRNDMGKVCKYGTINIKKLMQIKQFSHVQHMVTHIIGKLNKKNDMYDAFKAIFPAGTVTGAPKIRAIKIIENLECKKRGAYAGAIGYFSYNHCCDFAILIRSIFINNKNGFIQSGAGIVLDSNVNNELKELKNKAKVMLTTLKNASK